MTVKCSLALDKKKYYIQIILQAPDPDYTVMSGLIGLGTEW